ncbi:MAG: GAF domain-containing sensor histidine kinase [Phormidium sp. PBR-2020]|nr:MAG: GAF domain-containing sensor histidine kinase [Phormidium sp. PBR-2020]
MTDLAPTPNSLTTLRNDGLLDRNSRVAFQSAVETVFRALGLPIAWIWLLDHRELNLEIQRLNQEDDSLSLTGFNQDNKPSLFCTHVVETQQPLMVRDAARHPDFANQPLVQEDGVRAYLGVPLMTRTGDCLGTLAVMDTAPRSFAVQERTLVELAAGLAMAQLESPAGPSDLSQEPQKPEGSASAIHTQLLDRFLQELRTPLTSVMGMTSVLNREIYGPLRRKQKEYLDIIHNSGHYMLAMVEEILMLRELRDLDSSQSVSPVDLHMLCQQVLKILEPLASRREQQLLLSIEERDRLWTLDKSKFQQLLYHLVAHLIQISDLGTSLQVQIQRRCANQVEVLLAASDTPGQENLPESELERFGLLPNAATPSDLAASSQREVSLFGKLQAKPMQADDPDLGLFFACQLVHVQDGTLTIRGSATQGYRYVVTLGDRRDPHD